MGVTSRVETGPGACFPFAATFGAALPPPLAGPLAAPFPPPFLLSAIDHISRMFGDADLAAIIENFETNPGGLAILRISQRKIGDMDGCLFRDNASLLLGSLALVPFHEVDAPHDRALKLWQDLKHLTCATLVPACKHDHLVALFYFCSHHNTSGASEMIFM